MSTSEQQMQQLIDQAQMLTAELAAQRLELDAAITALDQQTQTATAALSVTQAAIAQMGETETQKKTLNPKLVNPPDPFQGTDADWERYKFGFATWISTVDPTYPDLLRKAERGKKMRWQQSNWLKPMNSCQRICSQFWSDSVKQEKSLQWPC